MTIDRSHFFPTQISTAVLRPASNTSFGALPMQQPTKSTLSSSCSSAYGSAASIASGGGGVGMSGAALRQPPQQLAVSTSRCLASPAPSSFTLGAASGCSSGSSGSRSTTPAASGSCSGSDKRSALGVTHEHLYKMVSARSARRHAPTLATGRRDLKHESGVATDEAERRRIRRERNRTAAAKCRRKRMDVTSELQHETEVLTHEKKALESELQRLEATRQHLEFVLRTHERVCRHPQLLARAASQLRAHQTLNQNLHLSACVAPTASAMSTADCKPSQRVIVPALVQWHAAQQKPDAPALPSMSFAGTLDKQQQQQQPQQQLQQQHQHQHQQQQQGGFQFLMPQSNAHIYAVPVPVPVPVPVQMGPNANLNLNLSGSHVNAARDNLFASLFKSSQQATQSGFSFPAIGSASSNAPLNLTLSQHQQQQQQQQQQMSHSKASEAGAFEMAALTQSDSSMASTLSDSMGLFSNALAEDPLCIKVEPEDEWPQLCTGVSTVGLSAVSMSPSVCSASGSGSKRPTSLPLEPLGQLDTTLALRAASPFESAMNTPTVCHEADPFAASLALSVSGAVGLPPALSCAHGATLMTPTLSGGAQPLLPDLLTPTTLTALTRAISMPTFAPAGAAQTFAAQTFATQSSGDAFATLMPSPPPLRSLVSDPLAPLTSVAYQWQWQQSQVESCAPCVHGVSVAHSQQQVESLADPIAVHGFFFDC